MNVTMLVDPIAGGMAIVNIAAHPHQPLHDGFVKGPYEGFYSIA
jgi:hypothetical protein